MKHRLCLAPIKGFTDHIYRNCFAKYFEGFDYAVAPFISTISGRKVNSKLVKGILPENNPHLPVVPQLLSNDPHDFIFFAKRLYDLGHEEVNWNLGCPHQKIAKKKRGSGLLSFPEEIDRILDRVIPSIPGKLSIKTRLGRESCDEIFGLMAVFNKYPLTELIVHPRTGVQLYEGSVFPDMFEACLERSKNPLSYNGDITCLGDFRALSDRFSQVDCWMIGRGAMADPTLPGRIKGISMSLEERAQALRHFHDELLESYDAALQGPKNVLGRMKAIWYYMAFSFKEGRRFYGAVSVMEEMDQYRAFVEDFFQADPELSSGQDPLQLNTEFLKHGAK